MHLYQTRLCYQMLASNAVASLNHVPADLRRQILFSLHSRRSGNVKEQQDAHTFAHLVKTKRPTPITIDDTPSGVPKS
jgi:hypothetical protein